MGKTQNKIIFKMNAISPCSFKDFEKKLMVVAVDYRTGKTVGKYTLEDMKLKFG